MLLLFLRKNKSENERRFLRPPPTPLPLGLYECMVSSRVFYEKNFFLF